MWTELYPIASDELAESLLTGPVILTGLPGAGRAPLVREIIGARPIVEVRPLQAGTADGLRTDAIRAVLQALSSGGVVGTRKDFHRLVASAFGPRAGEAVAMAESEGDDGLSLPEILEVVPPEAVLLVHDAHLLWGAWAERALWALRARVQQADRPDLIMLTRPWHRGILVGGDAPFFGFGQVLDLPTPGPADWAALSEPRIPLDELLWLLDETRGLPRPTLAVIRRVESGEPVHVAWAIHVRESERVALAVRQVVHGLHPYAPRLLGAIASGRRVYASVPGARTDAIATALRAMRDHDVIYQPRPRQWLVSDPALVAHLAKE